MLRDAGTSFMTSPDVPSPTSSTSPAPESTAVQAPSASDPVPSPPPLPPAHAPAASGHAHSLRQRLIVLVTSTVLVIWLVALGMAYLEAHDELDELLDQRLEQTAGTLIALDFEEVGERPATDSDDDDEFQQPDVLDAVQFQVWNRDGRLLLHSEDAPAVPFDDSSGFRKAQAGGTQWQSFARWRKDHSVQVRVFDDEGERRLLTAEIIGRVALPLTIALPLLTVLIWIAIGRALRPLQSLSRAVSARDAEHLSALDPEGIPNEVHPLILSLNALLERLGRSLDAERRFTADAAHELRTPLAAIRAQAQVALASLDPAERQHALDGIIAGADRATRLAVQLLTLARAERETPLPDTQVDLGAVARQSIALRAEAALRKEQELSLGGDETAWLAGDADLLEALCGNLVDNAIAYVQPGGHIEVTLHVTPAGVRLQVLDDGPGVESTYRQRLLDRFYRVPGNSSQGSGLGLSIAQHIARRHRATLTLTTGLDGGGFGVQVDFPAIKS